MATVLLFHHAQGQTPGFHAFAEELAGGHEMPDIARSTVALRAATELQKQRRKGAS